MSRAERALIVLVLASLGVWGCAQGPTNGAASAERVRALENKIAKLEDDFRAAVAVRDQLRKKLSTSEEEKSNLGHQVDSLQVVVRERDELRRQLTTRTAERDNVQTQFDQFRKGIKTLLGQAETFGPRLPVTSAARTPVTGKS
jgi:septal ring factor EnvC (AmiA/AmiB activator)